MGRTETNICTSIFSLYFGFKVFQYFCSFLEDKDFEKQILIMKSI